MKSVQNGHGKRQSDPEGRGNDEGCLRHPPTPKACPGDSRISGAFVNSRPPEGAAQPCPCSPLPIARSPTTPVSSSSGAGRCLLWLPSSPPSSSPLACISNSNGAEAEVVGAREAATAEGTAARACEQGATQLAQASAQAYSGGCQTSTTCLYATNRCWPLCPNCTRPGTLPNT